MVNWKSAPDQPDTGVWGQAPDQQTPSNIWSQAPDQKESGTGILEKPKEIFKTVHRKSIGAVPRISAGLTKFMGNLYKAFPALHHSAPFIAVHDALRGKPPQETTAKLHLLGQATKATADKVSKGLMRVADAPNEWPLLRPSQRTMQEMSSFQDHPVMFSLHHGFGAVPEFALAIGAAAMTGMPMAGAAMLGIPESADFFDLAKSKGMSDKSAGSLMLASATGLTLLEQLPIMMWLKGPKLVSKLAMGSPFAARAMMTGAQGAVEGVEEVAQKWWQDLLAKTTFDKGKSLNDFMRGTAAHFWPGVVMGTLFGPFAPDIDLAVEEMRKNGVKDEELERVAKEITGPMAKKYGISTQIADKFAEALVKDDESILKDIPHEEIGKIVEANMTTVHEETRIVNDEEGAPTPQTEERPHAIIPMENRSAAEKIVRKTSPFIRIKLGSGKMSSIKWAELDPAIREAILKEVEKEQNEKGKDFKPKQFIDSLFNQKYANTIFWTGTKKDVSADTQVWYKGLYMPIHEVVGLMDKLQVHPNQVNVIALRVGGAHAQGVTAQIAERLLADIRRKIPTGQFTIPVEGVDVNVFKDLEGEWQIHVPGDIPVRVSNPALRSALEQAEQAEIATKPPQPIPETAKTESAVKSLLKRIREHKARERGFEVSYGAAVKNFFDILEEAASTINPARLELVHRAIEAYNRGDAREAQVLAENALDYLHQDAEETLAFEYEERLKGKPLTAEEHKKIATQIYNDRYGSIDEITVEKTKAIDDGYLSPQINTKDVTEELRAKIKDIIGEETWQLFQEGKAIEAWKTINPYTEGRKIAELTQGMAPEELQSLFVEPTAEEAISAGMAVSDVYHQKKNQLFRIAHDYYKSARAARKSKKRLSSEAISKMVTFAKQEMDEVLSDYPDARLQTFLNKELDFIRKTYEGKDTLQMARTTKVTKLKDAKGGSHSLGPNQTIFIYPVEGRPGYVRVKDTDSFLTTWAILDKAIKAGDISYADQEIVGGGMVHPKVGPDGKDAYRYSLLQKGILRLIKLRGHDEGWLAEHAPTFLKEYMYPRPGVGMEKIMSTVAQQWIQTKRTEKLFHLMGLRAMDLIQRAVQEQVTKEELEPNVSQQRINTYLSLMNFAAEEIGHNEGDPITKFWLTENGMGGPYKDARQQTAVQRHLEKFHTALGRKYTQQQDRPQLAFFSLLPPYLQNMVIWTKANFENPMLKGLIDAGVLDNANIFKRARLGYTHRVWDYQDPQKRGRGWSNVLGSDYIPGAKYDTYAEFYDHTGEDAPEGVALVPIDNYGASISDYIRDGMQRMQQQEVIKLFKALPNPWQPGARMVEFEHNWQKKKDKDGVIRKPEWHLTKMNYRKINDAPGLTEWWKGSFRVPWVPDYIYETLRSLYNPHIAPGGVAKAWNMVNGAVKRMVMPTPHLFYLQILSTPIIYHPAAVKHLLPVLPSIGAVVGGMVGSPAGIPGALAGAGAGYLATRTATGILRKLIKGIPPEVISHGISEGIDVLRKNEKRFRQMEGMDPRKLMMFVRYGMPAFDFNWMMASFFDKAELKHPTQRTKWDSMVEFATTKFGIDTYVFNYLIPKMVYETTDSFYEHFKKKGHSDDKAAEMAASLVSNLTGVLDNNIYNVEGKLLQAFVFARNFTMGLARQITGATYPLWSKTLGHKYRSQGIGRYTNSLLHGETSEDVMKAIWGRYVKHLLVMVPLSRWLFANLMQYGLSFFDDDEKKRGNSFTWENHRFKKLQIRIPESSFLKENFGLHGKDRYGYQVYLDPLFWREAPQLMDILSVPGQGRGFTQLARSKLNYGVNLVASLLTDTDMATGQKLYGLFHRGEEVGFHEKALNAIRYAGRTAIPQAARADIRKPEMFDWLSISGMPLRFGGYPTERGYSREEIRDMSLEIRREHYEDEMLRKKIRLATPKQLEKMLDEGVITAEQYRNLLLKQEAPVSRMIRQNMKTLRERYFGR